MAIVYPDKIDVVAADWIPSLKLALDQGHIPNKNLMFAESLVKQFEKKGSLSPKQSYWAKKLVVDAGAGPLPIVDYPLPPEVKKVFADFSNEIKVSDFGEVYKWFDHAGKHLKKPKIHLKLPNGSPIMLYMGKGNPPYVQVSNGGPWGSSRWYGKVAPSGAWTLPYKKPLDEDFKDQLQGLLSQLAKEPVITIAQYGKMSGKCSFCNKTLTEAHSVAVGYGPICAKHYGLYDKWVNSVVQLANKGEGATTGKMVMSLPNVSNVSKATIIDGVDFTGMPNGEYAILTIPGKIFSVNNTENIAHYGKLPQNVFMAFQKLSSELSPENLTCDGELSAEQVKAKETVLLAQWKALEEIVGRLVTTSEIYSGKYAANFIMVGDKLKHVLEQMYPFGILPDISTEPLGGFKPPSMHTPKPGTFTTKLMVSAAPSPSPVSFTAGPLHKSDLAALMDKQYAEHQAKHNPPADEPAPAVPEKKKPMVLF